MPLLRVAATCVLVLAMAGCGTADEDPFGQGSGGSPAPDVVDPDLVDPDLVEPGRPQPELLGPGATAPAPDGEDHDADGPGADGSLTVADVTLAYRGERGDVVVSRPDELSHRLTLDPRRPGAAIVLDLPAGTTAHARSDGTAVVARDGERVLGLGTAPWQRLEVTRTQVRVENPVDGPPADRPLELWLGSEPVLRTEWGQREGGLSIAVVPAGWARTGPAGTEAVWDWLLAHEPDATGPGMQDQLECHAVGAAAKPAWNLEPWRPDVGLARVMLAGCNPVV